MTTTFRLTTAGGLPTRSDSKKVYDAGAANA